MNGNQAPDDSAALEPGTTTSSAAANAALLKKLAIIVIGMFGFGYLLVPFYEKICQATGLRNIAAPDVVTNTQVDATRSVRIEFDSNLRNLPWSFKPLQLTTSVNPGEVGQVLYEVANRTDRPITGQAIPSYAPQEASRYFKKLDCFCFAKQTLKPGEVRQMPVVFVIDPEMPRDIGTVTLSYTFFEVEGGAGKR
ncbi:MAG: cytochrome c oxidase assembly protein [Burkholderiales bacterium]